MTIALLIPPAWTVDALCLRVGEPEDWFPESGDRGLDAREVCGRCPVRATCLDHALTHPEPFGIWGGTSEFDRKRIRRES